MFSPCGGGSISALCGLINNDFFTKRDFGMIAEWGWVAWLGSLVS
jgi:hypothetical protein